MEALKKLKEVYEKKGFYFLKTEVWKRVMPIRFVRDMNVMTLHYQENAYRYLKKNYLPLLRNFKSAPYDQSEDVPSKIWVYWLQGIENAPEIVKRCYESLLKNSNGCEVILLTEKNLGEYIQIPNRIEEHLREKHMQYAQFSDYIRMALLERYGGAWIDATAFLSAPLPADLFKMDLFCFKTSYLDNSPMVASSWFIMAKKGNPIVSQVKYLLDEYWERETRLCDYYLLHLLFALVVKCDENSKRMWKNVPYVSNVDPHTLQFELFDDYREERFSEICGKSFIHKLTYKFHGSDPLSNPNSNYCRLIKGEIL